MYPRIQAGLVVMFLGLGALVHADSPGKARETPRKYTPEYTYRQQHDENGIGKFYMDREIAQVMGHQGASWLERPEREKEEQCSKLLPALKIDPGDSVADIGAGSGFYTFPLSHLVGPKGRVYAVDIQPEMLDIIRYRMRQWKLKNIQPVKGTVTNPKLKPASVDLILMVDVYHEFSHPYEMTVELVKALKPKGRLAFVEFRLEDEKVPILVVHRMSEKQVKKEMALHPVRHVETLKQFPWQHVIIFEKVDKNDTRKGSDPEKTPASRGSHKTTGLQGELKRLEGRWVPESMNLAGKGEVRDDGIKAECFIFKGTPFQREKDGKTIMEGKLEIDPVRKTMDLTAANRNPPIKALSIYELDGDRLTACFDLGGAGRPADLKAGKNRSVVVYKRQRSVRRSSGLNGCASRPKRMEISLSHLSQ